MQLPAFTVHAVQRYRERIRDAGDDEATRAEMLRCLEAAKPDDVHAIKDIVQVKTGCCVFLLKANNGKNDPGAVVTVLRPNRDLRATG